jgi:photosystem II stability/assembly factor-like uncharacterized protein
MTFTVGSPLIHGFPRACVLLGVLSVSAPVWTPQASGVNATLRGVSAVNDHVAWASGSGGTVLRTADGGATWNRMTVPADAALDFRDVDAIDERTAYLLSIGNGSASRIYKTVDAGTNWVLQFQNDDPRVFLDAMSFWDASHGIVMGDSIDGAFCIMTTSDGGKAWSRVPASALPRALANEGAFAASGTNIAVLGPAEAWIGTGAGATARVLHTTDRGRTWTIAATPMRAGPSAGIFSVAFRDRLHGIVVGGDYRLEREAVDNMAVTSDGGRTWTPARGLSGFRSVVAYIPGRAGALLAAGPQGSDLSDDDGHSWRPLPGPGYHTVGFSPTGNVAFGAGAMGAIGRFGG